MRKYFLYALIMAALPVQAQRLTGFNFRVINMIPATNSNETSFDSETNVAVNPANPNIIVGTAFTPNPTGTTTRAPIFVSTNGGTTWAMNNIVPSGNGMTGDISVGFSRQGGNLYAGILRGGSSLRTMILRSNDPAGGALMTILRDRNTEITDQPYVTSSTVNDGGGVARDRAFIGVNNLSASGGQTAEVMTSNDAASAPPSAFNNLRIETRNTNGQDMPPIRAALHSSGVVYAIFYRWASGNLPSPRCDVVVVRDDGFAAGAATYGALTDASDGNAGRLVATNVLVPSFSGTSFGNNRLVASNLSIAVDPGNSNIVYVAWCDRVSTTDYTLHVRRSTDAGANWGTADLLTITNATNPALAINNSGRVGLAYQRLDGTGAAARWFTHFRSTARGGATFTNDTLAIFNASLLNSSAISPALGDYMDMEAVGETFYGVFPSGNVPNNANFPRGVVFQRNASFGTQTLRGNDGTSSVTASVDPYFFSVTPRLKLLSVCDRFPLLCITPRLKDDWIIIRCRVEPCFERIPIPEICKRALDCPGCGPNALCNPYMHIFLDDIDPREFTIKLLDKKGNELGFDLNQTGKGVAISFKIDKKALNKQGVPDYDLMIINETGLKNTEKKVRFALQTSDYRFEEHVKMYKK